MVSVLVSVFLLILVLGTDAVEYPPADLTQANDSHRALGRSCQTPVFYSLYAIHFHSEGVNHPPINPNMYPSQTIKDASCSATRSIVPPIIRLRHPLLHSLPRRLLRSTGKAGLIHNSDKRRGAQYAAGYCLRMRLRYRRGRKSCAWVYRARKGPFECKWRSSSYEHETRLGRSLVSVITGEPQTVVTAAG